MGARARQSFPCQAQFRMVPCASTVNRVTHCIAMFWTGVVLCTYVVDVPEYEPKAEPEEPYTLAVPLV